MKTAKMRLGLLLAILIVSGAQGYDKETGFICEDCEEELKSGITFNPSWVEILDNEEQTVVAGFLEHAPVEWSITSEPKLRVASVLSLIKITGVDAEIRLKGAPDIPITGYMSTPIPGRPAETSMTVEAKGQDNEGKPVTGSRSLKINGYAPYLERPAGGPNVITVTTGQPLTEVFVVRRTTNDTDWNFQAIVNQQVAAHKQFLDVAAEKISPQGVRVTLTGKPGGVLLVATKTSFFWLGGTRVSDGRKIATGFKVNVIILPA